MVDFHLGAAASLRDRIAKSLRYYDADMPGYGYALGMHAFGLEECGAYEQAEQVGLQAVEINRDDVWAIHAVAHVRHMQGQPQKGIDWYTSCESDWNVGNSFAIHNWWHQALFYFDLQQFDQVLDIYDASLSETAFAIEAIDATALLWRLRLAQVETGDRWRRLADKWEAELAETDFYCFNDVHAMVAFIGAERWPAAQRVVDRVTDEMNSSNFASDAAGQAGYPVIRSLLDYGQGRFGDALASFSQVREWICRIGGSHAQRELLTFTMLDAALRSGRREYVCRILNERKAAKAACTLTQQFMERL